MKPKKKKDQRKPVVTKGKGGTNDGNKEVKKKSPDDDTVSKGVLASVPTKVGQNPIAAASNAAPDNNNDKCDDEKQELSTSTFGPRKIVSNWSRYEEATNDKWSEDEQQDLNGHRKHAVAIGTDFNVALSAASEVGEQFRFREEKEWDNEDEEENGEESFSYCRLDISDQVRTLSCVPLPHKLDVDASYFTHHMIEQFEEIALANHRALMAMRKTSDCDVQVTDLERKQDELDVLLEMAERRSKVNESLPTGSLVPAFEALPRRETSSEDIQSLEDWLDTVNLD